MRSKAPPPRCSAGAVQSRGPEFLRQLRDASSALFDKASIFNLPPRSGKSLAIPSPEKLGAFVTWFEDYTVGDAKGQAQIFLGRLLDDSATPADSYDVFSGRFKGVARFHRGWFTQPAQLEL